MYFSIVWLVCSTSIFIDLLFCWVLLFAVAASFLVVDDDEYDEEYDNFGCCW